MPRQLTIYAGLDSRNASVRLKHTALSGSFLDRAYPVHSSDRLSFFLNPSYQSLYTAIKNSNTVVLSLGCVTLTGILKQHNFEFCNLSLQHRTFPPFSVIPISFSEFEIIRSPIASLIFPFFLFSTPSFSLVRSLSFNLIFFLLPHRVLVLPISSSRTRFLIAFIQSYFHIISSSLLTSSLRLPGNTFLFSCIFHWHCCSLCNHHHVFSIIILCILNQIICQNHIFSASQRNKMIKNRMLLN